MAEVEDGMVGAGIEVVHVGSASRDIATDDPRGWRLGGGATYAALTTARLGVRTAALIGVDSAAASAHELDLLRDAGVDLQLVHLAQGPVFDNRETPGGRVQMSHGFGDRIEAPMLPARWLVSPAWSLVPVAGELGDDWAAIVPEGAYLALGWQGMLRALGSGGRVERQGPSASALLARADLVGVSHRDLAAGTSLAALSGYLHPGADLIITEGREGGLLVRVGEVGARETFRYPSVTSDRELDPTGAGDTFLAALLVSAIRADGIDGAGSGPPLDLAFAAAAGSLVVEGPGLSAVPDRGSVELRASRIRSDFRITTAADERIVDDRGS